MLPSNINNNQLKQIKSQSNNIVQTKINFNSKKDNSNSKKDNSKKQEIKLPQNQQFSDPILNVRDRIAQNFGVPFQQTIYIKKGTNITQQQYFSAKQRMHLWKYFNVKTKQYEFIEQAFTPQVYLKLNRPQNQHILQKMKQAIKLQQEQYQKKYNISKYKQIPFCIIAPSYKNADKIFRNLNSIFQQNYQNLHVVFIDDASNDGTDQLVRNYIQKYAIPKEKINLIVNIQNKRALPNIDFAARNLCRSGQIMTILDGDDYLIGRSVFKIINAQYQIKELLALYTNHLRINQPYYLKVGTCIDYPESIKRARSYRHYSVFPASHLRTFYVDLYWRIKIRDLKNIRGQFFTAANDFAIMMPVLQMAGKRFQYFPQLTYIYDSGTGNNNFQTKTLIQAKNAKITKRRHKYPKLINDLNFASLFIKQKQKQTQALLNNINSNNLNNQNH